MGTFLYEFVNEDAFDTRDREEIRDRTLEILRELGEVGIEQIRLQGYDFAVMNMDKFCSKNDIAEIYFNYFERQGWEPSFVDLDPQKFTGVRSWAIGSKIGYGEHFRAMLAARVFCECNGGGSYIVYGDVGSYGVKMALRWIAGRYGIECCRPLVEQRMKYENIWEVCEKDPYYCRRLPWNKVGILFCEGLFLILSEEHWDSSMKEEYSGELKKLEAGEMPEYVGTYFYLYTCLLRRVLKDELEAWDTEKIRDVFRRYAIEKPIEDFPIPSDMEYEQFWKKQLSGSINTCQFVLKSPKIICKIISDITGEEFVKIEALVMEEYNCSEANKMYQEYYSVVKILDRIEQGKHLDQIMADIEEHPLSTAEYMRLSAEDMLIYYHGQFEIPEETDLRIRELAGQIKEGAYEECPLEKEHLGKLLHACQKLFESGYLMITSELFYDLMHNRTGENELKLEYLEKLGAAELEEEDKRILIAVLCNKMLCENYLL